MVGALIGETKIRHVLGNNRAPKFDYFIASVANSRSQSLSRLQRLPSTRTADKRKAQYINSVWSRNNGSIKEWINDHGPLLLRIVLCGSALSTSCYQACEDVTVYRGSTPLDRTSKVMIILNKLLIVDFFLTEENRKSYRKFW